MIKQIELTNFRKFESLKLNIEKNIIIIVGKNALGKTSILESIYLSSLGKSHRTNNDKEMIKFNCEFASILINAEKKYRTIISNNGKKFLINKISQKRLSDFIGDLKVVLFSPDDLKLIKGSPSESRKFMDIEISKVNNLYLDNLNTYRKYLKQRNDLLKNLKIDDDLIFLDIITKQMIEVAKKIIIERTKFIEEINNNIQKYHNHLSKKICKIKYSPSVNIDNIEKVFEQKKHQDILSKTTNYGIQRDILEYYLDDLNAYNYASQGEIRSIVIALKLSLIDFIWKIKKEYPIILLDDCLSELDLERQKYLIELLQDNYQTFITTTEISELSKIIKKEYMTITLKEMD